VLSADRKLIITAATQAQKAVDFILNRHVETEEAA
jgi:antirestriction protein ArdC